MTDGTECTPPAIRRQLGRSRSYTDGDLSKRLVHWHAPRANRWERLCVTGGVLEVQWLGPNGVTTDKLHVGTDRWIAPGTRWRVARMHATTRFALEIHADDATPVSTPPALRSAWFDHVECAPLADATAWLQLIADLVPGQSRLVRGGFALSDALLQKAVPEHDQTLFWHPLDRGDGRFTAFIARAAQPIGLAEYLGRDHALIEATLAGTLRGDAEQARWLHTSLARHLAIEEALLFPAYLRAHGNAGWIRGLRNEHEHLRHGLGALSDPAARRRFLLLLDGHDEKEEQIVYPDILAHLDAEADALTRAAMLYSAPP